MALEECDAFLKKCVALELCFGLEGVDDDEDDHVDESVGCSHCWRSLLLLGCCSTKDEINYFLELQKAENLPEDQLDGRRIWCQRVLEHCHPVQWSQSSCA